MGEAFIQDLHDKALENAQEAEEHVAAKHAPKHKRLNKHLMKEEAIVRGTPLVYLGSQFLSIFVHSIFVLFYFCSPLSTHTASLSLQAVLG